MYSWDINFGLCLVGLSLTWIYSVECLFKPLMRVGSPTHVYGYYYYCTCITFILGTLLLSLSVPVKSTLVSLILHLVAFTVYSSIRLYPFKTLISYKQGGLFVLFLALRVLYSWPWPLHKAFFRWVLEYELVQTVYYPFHRTLFSLSLIGLFTSSFLVVVIVCSLMLHTLSVSIAIPAIRHSFPLAQVQSKLGIHWLTPPFTPKSQTVQQIYNTLSHIRSHFLRVSPLTLPMELSDILAISDHSELTSIVQQTFDFCEIWYRIDGTALAAWKDQVMTQSVYQPHLLVKALQALFSLAKHGERTPLEMQQDHIVQSSDSWRWSSRYSETENEDLFCLLHLTDSLMNDSCCTWIPQEQKEWALKSIFLGLIREMAESYERSMEMTMAESDRQLNRVGGNNNNNTPCTVKKEPLNNIHMNLNQIHN